MSTKIPVTTAGGTQFFVEVEGDADATVDPTLVAKGGAMGAEDRVLKASVFRKAVAVVQDISQEVASGLDQVEPKPSEVQLSLDLGFDAGGSVWILKGGAKASMRLSVKWKTDAE